MDMLSLMLVNLGEIGRASKSGCADQDSLRKPKWKQWFAKLPNHLRTETTEEIDMFFTKTNSRRWNYEKTKLFYSYPWTFSDL